MIRSCSQAGSLADESQPIIPDLNSACGLGNTKVIPSEDSAGFASCEESKAPPNASPNKMTEIGRLDECFSALIERHRRPIALYQHYESGITYR